MTGLLRSLRTLILGETWSVPAGVAGTLAVALGVRAALPHEAWATGGGFLIALLVALALALSLRTGR